MCVCEYVCIFSIIMNNNGICVPCFFSPVKQGLVKGNNRVDLIKTFQLLSDVYILILIFTDECQ